MAEEIKTPNEEAGGDQETGQPAASPPAEEGQPETPDYSDLNLDDVPGFRDWKSAQDQKSLALLRQNEQLQAQLNQLGNTLQQAQLENMTPAEQQAYREQQLQQQIASLEGQLQQANSNSYKEAVFAKIMGVYPVNRQDLSERADNLGPNETIDDLWVWASKHSKTRRKRKPRAEQSDTGDAVDVGQGAPPVDEATKLLESYKKAQENRDAKTLLSLGFEARAKGIDLHGSLN